MFQRYLRRGIALATCLVLAIGAGPTSAQSPGAEILRAGAPAWVIPQVLAETSEGPSDLGLRILLLDIQVRDDRETQSYHVRTRSRASTPQGVAALGSVAVEWRPASQSVTLHHVNIERGDEVIDVLATQSFETLRRETNLEIAVLDGALTAILQPAGLRVGDVLDVAYTLATRDPVTGDHFELVLDPNLTVPVDRLRYRASWPSEKRISLRGPEEWSQSRVRREGGFSTLELRREAVDHVLPPNDVPERFLVADLIELTEYARWSDVAVALRPLYDAARRIDPGSPLQAEVARIRALSDDPAIQAAAALRLVQDEVRYVAMLMGEGALTPASADETWARRFGDCKAKTVLLLALLDGLGIQAQPAAVSLAAGDGLQLRLPMVGAFDHVVVRAEIDGRVHWLDGTRQGDRRLEDLVAPAFGWALPLNDTDAALERIENPARAAPDVETKIALDATAGLHAPAGVEASMIFRGRAAATLGGQLGFIAGAQRDQTLREVWSGYFADLDIQHTDAAYDPERNLLTLSVTGSTPLLWSGRGLTPPGASYMPITAAERPVGPFRTAPYRVNHPTFESREVTVRLPEGGRGFRMVGGVFDRTEFGHRITRSTHLAGDTATIEFSMRSLVDEISAESAVTDREAAEARPQDLPRIVPPDGYTPTEQDRAAWAGDLPTTAGGWLDRGYTLSQAGEHEAAVEAAAKAIELAPENSSGWANRGVYRYWAGDREGALEDLDKAVELDPSERIAMNGHALLAMAEGRFQDAVVEMSRALRQVPRDEFALSTRANAYFQLEQYDRALRDIDVLVELYPERADLAMWRVSALQRAGRDGEASQAILALAQAHPDSPQMRFQHATRMLRDDDAQGAFDLINELIESGADVGASSRLVRAEAALELARTTEAKADIEAARSAHPDNADIRGQICAMSRLGPDLEEDLWGDCEAAYRLAPTSPAYRIMYVRSLVRRESFKEALEILDEDPEGTESMSMLLALRGQARIGLGQTEEGEADMAAARELPSRVRVVTSETVIP